MSATASNRAWNRDNGAALKLAREKKAAAKREQPAESWWIGQSRDEFYRTVAERTAARIASQGHSLSKLNY